MPVGQMNSAGSLVGAILESAGYYYQSHILDNLGEPLTNSIGALVYLFGVSVAIFHFAVFRSSKMGMWLFIGPPIFFAVLKDRVDINDATWSFGSNARNQAEVEQGRRDIVDFQGSPRVSRVFKKYIEMIGGSVKEIVDTINGVQVQNDVWFIAKGQLFGYMTTATEEDVGLRQLIHYGLSGQCYQAIQAGQAISNPLLRTNTQGPASGVVDAALRFFMPNIFEANKKYNEMMNKTINFSNNSTVRDYLKNLGVSIDDNNRDLMFRCQDIWEIILVGIRQKAEFYKAKMDRSAEQLGIDVPAIDNLLGQASGIPSTNKLLSRGVISNTASSEIVKVISKYYLRNELNAPDRGSLLANFASRNDIRKVHMKMQGEFATSERAGLNAGEWGFKENLMYVASSLPTFQGLILYFLGVTFPFFALLLLIPGKAQGFFLWFALWLWAKSWDIGVSMVMQLDTIFWSLYVVQKQKMSGGADILDNNLGVAISALEQMDPTFQMAGYYNILAVALNAVPIITANLILGGMKGGSGIISQGISRYAEFFSEGATVRTEQGAITQMKSDAIALKSLRGLALGASQKQRDQVLSENGREDPNSQIRQLWEQGKSTFESAVGYSTISRPANFNKELLSGAVALADKSGFASGISSPGANLSQGMGSTMPNSMINLAYLKDRLQGREQLDQAFKTASVNAGAQIAQAEWEASIERQAYDLHYQMAIYRAIPVPWTYDGSELSGPEVDRHINEFNNKVNMLKNYTSMINEVGKEVLGTTERTGKKAEGIKSPPVSNTSVPGNILSNIIDDKSVQAVASGLGGAALGSYVGSMITPKESEHKRIFEEYQTQAENFNKEKTNHLVNEYLNLFPGTNGQATSGQGNNNTLGSVMHRDLEETFSYSSNSTPSSFEKSKLLYTEQELAALPDQNQSYEDFMSKFYDSSRFTDTRNIEEEYVDRRYRQRDIGKAQRFGKVDREDKF